MLILRVPGAGDKSKTEMAVALASRNRQMRRFRMAKSSSIEGEIEALPSADCIFLLA
jgi:hypothetical protein